MSRGYYLIQGPLRTSKMILELSFFIVYNLDVRLVTLWSPMSNRWACIPPCGRTFSSPSGLTIHQMHCKVLGNHESQAAASRRNAASLRPRDRAAKQRLFRIGIRSVWNYL